MIDLYHFKLLYRKNTSTAHEILYNIANNCTIMAEFNLFAKNKIDTGITTNIHKLPKATTFGYFASPPDNKIPQETDPTASIATFRNCMMKITLNVG